MQEEQSFDVAIVGYGPTGATLANLLGKRGFTVAVVDQVEGIYDKPRASSADHEAMRIFQECGLADEIEPDTSPHPGTDYLGLEGQIIKRFYPQPKPFPLGWEPTFMFVQPKLEAVLRRGAQRYPGVRTFLGHRLESFTQDASGVRVQLQCVSDPSTFKLQARYLLACDGGRSTVRRALSIGLEDLDFDEWWIVVDAWLEGEAELPPRSVQYCHPARPATYIVGHGKLRRWEIKLLPGESPEDFKSEESVRRVLAQVVDLAPLRLWRTAVYEFHAVVAQRWRVGRVFLLGDAAHQTPPFLAQGMCAGIRDAANLAWKLDAVERLGCSESLLDTYEEERKPHVRTIVAHAKEFGKIIGELDMDAARRRDERLAAEIAAGTAQTIRQRFIPNLANGLLATSSDGTLSQGAGAILVQPWVFAPDGAMRRLDDLLPSGFLLISADEEPLQWLDEESRGLWTRIAGAQAVVIGPEAAGSSRSHRACDDLFDKWLESLQARVVLVRPDKYLYGAAVDPESLNALIRQLAKELAAA